MIDSNLRQMSGNVWNVNWLVGEDAGDLLLGDEGRGNGVGGGQQQMNNIGPVKSVKEIRKFWSL